jgi:hypothetical protein
MSHGETGENNLYANWVREKNQIYITNGIKRLSGGLQPSEYITTPPANFNVKSVSWRLASDLTVSTKDLESCIHAVERTPSEGQGKPALFVPIRFEANNKLTKFDKLMIAFDALILSESSKCKISQGKIIHGDGFPALKVNIPALLGDVKKVLGKINSMLTEKERKKLNSKGIFTVSQLSYTFRPRRRPKRQRDKHEKYHHSLKALALREKKVHIVGSPELKIDGKPVYLDVEGLPDRDFYYLVGLRFMQGDVVVHRSLWADSREDEEKIWKEFVELLSTIDNPVLIHYGSYETTFIKTMCNRYGVSWDSKLPSIQSCEVSENSQLSSEINVSQIAKKKQGLKS